MSAPSPFTVGFCPKQDTALTEAKLFYFVTKVILLLLLLSWVTSKKPLDLLLQNLIFLTYKVGLVMRPALPILQVHYNN